MRIVYYAHHQGSGHLRQARRLQHLGVAEVVVAGPRGADVELPPDVDPDDPWHEPADSPFHWAPLTTQVRRRFRAWHELLTEADPDVVMVDVSVEAAVFARLAGYRVLYCRMPGRRDDDAHRLAYRASSGLFAYYPRELEEPGFAFAERTRWLGTVSDTAPTGAEHVEPGTVVVLTGAGGGGVTRADLRAAARAVPSRTWHVLGPRSLDDGEPLPGNLVEHGWVADPAPWLARAEVVVCGAGANTIATVAGTRRPLVVAPEARPHDEQLVFARRLHEVYGVPIVEEWTTAGWPELVAHPGDGRALADRLLSTSEQLAQRVRSLLDGATGR